MPKVKFVVQYPFVGCQDNWFVADIDHPEGSTEFKEECDLCIQELVNESVESYYRVLEEGEGEDVSD